MEILTASEMSAVDRRTAAEFGVSLTALMENAGAAVARFCLRQHPAARRVVVLCGKGNNGGDGLVAARRLAAAGIRVTALLVGREDEVRSEAALALARLRAEAAEVVIRAVVDEASMAGAREEIASAELLVDALVGTGFKPPLRGLAVELCAVVAKSKAAVVAVDLPSGWDADSTDLAVDGAFRADAVVTFTAPKLAHCFGHLTGATFGPVVVAEIGSPAEAVTSAGGLSWAGAAKALAEEPRVVDANKGRFGHVAIIGGSYGMAGAPSMASMAALRTGAGLVTVVVPRAILPTVAAFAPELMVRQVEKAGIESGFSAAALSEERLERLLKGANVVGIGPGLGQVIATQEFVRGFVERVRLGVVVDADALNAFAGRADLLNGDGRTLVLTPHPGEMARLVGLTVAEVEADRIGLARRFAIEHKLTLVLKGWRTLVAHPDGRVAVNTSGNPAMAKGGSGDILTGMVAAMLAQFPRDVARAVDAAVYLHGLAGDFAAQAMDEHTVLATDTLAHLSQAFRYQVRDGDGLTWICGLRGEKA
jgi:NAD(P)H-hydrate epimerase